jgi:hypothetical protein
MEEFHNKVREEVRSKMKFSGALLELRKKEQMLVKIKKYEQAEEVKSKADRLEHKERNRMEIEVCFIFSCFANIYICTLIIHQFVLLG